MKPEAFRKCLSFIDREARWRWLGLIVLGVIAGAVEATGAVLLVILLGAITETTTTTLPVVGGLVVADPDRFVLMCVLAAAFFVVRAGVLIGQVYLQHRLANNAGVRLSGRLLRGYLAAPYVVHLRRNSAELIRNAHESVDLIARYVFAPLLTMASEALLVLAVVGVLLVVAPLATIAAATALTLIGFALLRGIQPRMAALGDTSQRMSKQSLKSLQESLAGFRDVRVLGRESFFYDQFVKRRVELARSYYLGYTLSATPRTVIEMIFVLCVIGFLVAASAAGSSLEQMLPLLALFAYAVLRILPATNRIILSMTNLRFGTAAIDNVYADLAAGAPRPARAEAGVLSFTDQLRLEGVCFRYPDTSDDVLFDVDLAISRGQSVGLVGPTGGGKTTLVDVIIGLLEPTTGRVTADGVDIHRHAEAWQRNVGMVPQTVFLLDDTLRRNVAFGVPDDQIDEAKVWGAIRLAQLDEFVAALPDRLDTLAGERGVRLSGGQRQRVAIARALYAEPQVVVLDEGTSALDNLTEAEIIRALDRLRGDHTVVTVAHRLTTVRGCDLIVVLEEGRIVATGTYDELVAGSEKFRKMVG